MCVCMCQLLSRGHRTILTLSLRAMAPKQSKVLKRPSSGDDTKLLKKPANWQELASEQVVEELLPAEDGDLPKNDERAPTQAQRHCWDNSLSIPAAIRDKVAELKSSKSKGRFLEVNKLVNSIVPRDCNYKFRIPKDTEGPKHGVNGRMYVGCFWTPLIDFFWFVCKISFQDFH